MSKLLQTLFFALLLSSAVVFGKPKDKHKDKHSHGGGHTGSSSTSNENDGIGREDLKCDYDGSVTLSCEEGYVIELSNTQLSKGRWRCYDEKLDERIKTKCDGKTECTLSCSDDDLYNDLDCPNYIESAKPKLKGSYMCRPDPCSNHYCANGGSCLAVGLIPTCECLGDWKGERCDVSPCEGFDGCEPGESCRVDTDDGTPKCCPGEVNPCESITCGNGGSCLLDWSDWSGKCCCTDGYRGINCEIKIDACTDNPCKNDGVCTVDTNGEAKCSCEGDFAGPTCDVDCTEAVICPADTITISGYCYHISTDTAESWLAAKAVCESKGLTLWEPNHDNEKNAVAAQLENEKYWTGATDMQVEGTTIFTGSGNPIFIDINGSNTAQKDCVELIKTSSGNVFEYRDCTTVRRYVCEQLNPCDGPPTR